jgi:hypothetical protein
MRARFRPAGVLIAALALLASLPAAITAQDAGGTPPPPERIPYLLAGTEGHPPSETDRLAALSGIQAQATARRDSEATLWLQLLAVAEKSGPAAGALAARSVLAAEEGTPEAGADLLDGGLALAEQDDLPGLLALAAHLVDGRDPGRAASYREALLETKADAPEAWEARLLLARFLAREREGTDRALELLEDLIVNRPGHPVAPEARRLFQSLRNPGSSGG